MESSRGQPSFEFGSHLSQFGNRVHVAGGGVFGGMDTQPGLSHAVGVVSVDLPLAELELLDSEIGDSLESVGSWRLPACRSNL